MRGWMSGRLVKNRQTQGLRNKEKIEGYLMEDMLVRPSFDVCSHQVWQALNVVVLFPFTAPFKPGICLGAVGDQGVRNYCRCWYI